MQKIDQLTFTRFVAAMLVVIYHSAANVLPFTLFPINYFIASSGFTAVAYFFVLSGFIMAYAYYQPEGKFRFGAYAQARIARIYPVYLFSLLVTLWYYREIVVHLFDRKLLANVLMVQAWIPRYALSFNVPAWSLSVEAFFYLLFPFLALFASRIRPRTLVWISVIFWFVSQVVHMTLLHLYMPEERFILLYNPLVHLDSFLLGMAGGVWYLSEAPRLQVSPKVNLGLLGGAALAAIALMIVDAMNPGSFYLVDSGFFAPLFLIIVLTVALDRTRLSAILRKPFFVLLGDASYSLYILHVPVRWLLEQYTEGSDVALSYPYIYYYGYYFLILAVSILTFKLIEAPSRKLLREVFRRAFPPPQLFLWDLLAIVISIAASFFLRLGPALVVGPAALVRKNIHLFVTAFIILLFARTIAFAIIRLYAKTSMPVSFIKTAGIVVGSVSLGSLLGGILWFLFYKIGFLESFSRSILLMEWSFSCVSVFLAHYSSLKRRQVAPSSA
jgi:peptidoglycan/LPS O-acetylase OafA/YrhL